jgi:hypothetical protein
MDESQANLEMWFEHSGMQCHESAAMGRQASRSMEEAGVKPTTSIVSDTVKMEPVNGMVRHLFLNGSTRCALRLFSMK